MATASLTACFNSPETEVKTKEVQQPTNQATTKTINTNLKILRNSLGFTIAGEAGQSIYFGNDDDFYCSATWQLDRLDPQAEKALVKKTKRNKDKTFSIECDYQEQYFTQSSKHDTLAEILIIDNNPEAKTASFIVKLDLFNTTSESPRMLSMDYQLMKVTPEQYELIF